MHDEEECSSPQADKLRAGLALRGLLGSNASRKGDDANGDFDDEAPSGYSVMHRSLRAEIDATLKSSLRRRMDNVERKVDDMHGSKGRSKIGKQGGEGKKLDSVNRLQKSLAMSMKHAERCTKKPVIRGAFGPSYTQAELTKQQPDPCEKPAEVHKETVVLKSTLQSLRQALTSRERQIEALTAQLHECKSTHEEVKGHATNVENGLQNLLEEPDSMEDVHTSRVGRRQHRVQELERNVEKVRAQAVRYQALAQQQRSFYTQTERVAACGGARVVARHPAGAIFLVAQPLSIADEKPDVWDVGTAIANPYVCDSWPFEPNVLARRSFDLPEDRMMQSLGEETAEDLEERNDFRRGFGRGRLDLRLPELPRRADSDEDGYEGPSETARSL